MGGENKYISNKPSVLNTGDSIKNVQIGIVASIDDSESLGRIKVAIPGSANNGGDDGIDVADLPWCYPMIPKFFSSTPRVGEGVFVLIHDKNKTHSDRLYFGPIISQLDKLNIDPVNTTALSPFTYAFLNPQVNFNMIPAIKGVFPSDDDIAIQGRYNTDIILKKNEILIRGGKFVESEPNANNPFSFQFNDTTQGYFHIRNNIPLERPKNNETVSENGSVINVVANKINLLTHKDGSPRYKLMDQEGQIDNDEILNILETAHQLPFGDILIEYLKLLKSAFLNHVHNNNGRTPTDLTAGGAKQDVSEFKKKAEDLESRMLSRNIRIN